MTTLEIENLLAVRYAPPSYAFIREVRNGTGYAHSPRTMDAMAFGLWPSRGLELIGFEIKVSRSDWQRELKQPEKAEAFYRYLDRWYIVAAENVVRTDELPIGWGFILAKGDKLKTVVEAAVKKAKPIDRTFLMAIIRNFDSNYVARSIFKAEVDKGIANGIETAVERAKLENDYKISAYENLLEIVSKFESASGVEIKECWRNEAGNIGRAVKFVLEHGEEKIRERLQWTLNGLRETVKNIEESLRQGEGNEENRSARTVHADTGTAAAGSGNG